MPTDITGVGKILGLLLTIYIYGQCSCKFSLLCLSNVCSATLVYKVSTEDKNPSALVTLPLKDLQRPGGNQSVLTCGKAQSLKTFAKK